MFKSILLATILLSTGVFSGVSNSHAESPDLHNNPALKITSVSVSEVETLSPMLELPTVGNPIGDIITTIDGIIAVGQRIWKIVDAGRPVITTKLAPMISVLPHLEGENPTLNQMASWSAPKVRSYRVSFKNGFGSEVVGFTYTIYFQFNGSLKGTGKYITNLKVQASEIYTSWGFNFDATSELVGIANVGSMDAPVASATMQISYTVKGLVNESRSSQGFYVDGAGNIQVIP
ncbi:MAG: hypothetical protein H7281_07340 [Bacteriovorax sp.]|nr:hypothetical protein [Bacteriovorax sp.]